MKEYLITIGIVIIFLGMILITVGMINKPQKDNDTKSKMFVGGFIGPIPFGFGNDKEMFYIGIILSAIIITILIYINMKNI